MSTGHLSQPGTAGLWGSPVTGSAGRATTFWLLPPQRRQLFGQAPGGIVMWQLQLAAGPAGDGQLRRGHHHCHHGHPVPCCPTGHRTAGVGWQVLGFGVCWCPEDAVPSQSSHDPSPCPVAQCGAHGTKFPSFHRCSVLPALGCHHAVAKPTGGQTQGWCSAGWGCLGPLSWYSPSPRGVIAPLHPWGPCTPHAGPAWALGAPSWAPH